MEAPPVLPAATASSTPPVLTVPKAAWRWLVMLVLLASYPLILGLLAEVLGRYGIREVDHETTILPKTTQGLLLVCAENVGLFALLFAGAWCFARPSLDDLWARWRRPWLTTGLGVLWSVALRLAVGILVAGVFLGLTLWQRLTHGQEVSLDAFRPKVEHLIAPEALHSPFYLLVAMTLVSFVVAGLREELWRAGMLVAFNALLPERWRNWRGQAAAIMFAAIIFGLGHLPQGAGGVLLTGLLGIGLGWVMTFHRSLWVAVLAHGFFDATSFFLIWVLERSGLLKQLIPG